MPQNAPKCNAAPLADHMPDISARSVLPLPQPDDLLDSYRFELPEGLIASRPATRRDASRLMVLGRHGGEPAIHTFADLPSLLPGPCLLVANNTRVVPARLLGQRAGGGRSEFLLLTPLPQVLASAEHHAGWSSAEVEGLLRAGPKPGGSVTFAEELRLTVREKCGFGRTLVRLHWQGQQTGLPALFDRLGQVPLPPYLGRQADETDRERYQTVYAAPDKPGSAAAPTAGLHFTPELRQTLLAAGHHWAEVTLHVGYGTFSPIRVDDLRQHRMHAEPLELSPDTARAIAEAKAQGRKVIAVGTTTARCLEGAFQAMGRLAPFSGETSIFIHPGHQFQVLDGLITNFHLPGSSLLALVSALTGRQRLLDAYAVAIAQGLRFYSYGDAMLVR